MKPLDRFLQAWRRRMALRHLPARVRLLDIGAHEGELFKVLGERLEEGFGLEPLLDSELSGTRYRVVKGYFPEVAPDKGDWNVITMLAVLEHIPDESQIPLAEACHRFLAIGGLVIVTVPSPFVDHILALLTRLRLIDGMSLEEHHQFRPEDTEKIFAAPKFRLLHRKRFQLGLNNLYVFRKEG